MKITSVKVVPVHNDECLKAFVSIVIDSCFAVHNLKIIKNGEKTFIAMPNKPGKDKQFFRDIAHPLNQQTRSMIEKVVFEEYYKSLNEEPENFNKKTA